MANGDKLDDYRPPTRNGNTTRLLAVIALVIAVIALLWAIRADNRAGDALEEATTTLEPAL